MFPEFTKIINRIAQTITRRNQNGSPFMFLKSHYGSAPTSEEALKALLENSFPNAKVIKVEDISGGCGAMYTIYVESTDFKGLSIVKQHQAITNVLKEQIKQIHGLRIETKIPK